MIPKSEREHDRATFNAAEHGYRVHEGLLYRTDGTRPITSMGGEWLPQFVAAAFTRVPTYIDALDEMERRIAAVEKLAQEVERGDAKFAHASVKGSQAAMRCVMRLLRGGQ